ncbi:MAG: hypothetical protein AB7F22_10650 [Reyranella sp.]|uniref:hypothetical protein n=1 Tax=Reyranella sp. TaxID=1929291 RepID=UPI003D0A97F8
MVDFTTIGFPGDLLRISSGSFRLRPFQTSPGSIYSGFVRAYGSMQMRWTAECEMAGFAGADNNAWDAFIARLEGQVNLFEVSDPLHDLPRGAGAGYAPDNTAVTITGVSIPGVSIVEGATSCLVKTAAARYARTIIMKGLAADEVVFRGGDYFGLDGNLYMVSGDVTADENGDARVPFKWRLWKPAAVDDVVQLLNPTARFQLASADQGTLRRTAPDFGSAGLSLIEVPYTS